MLIPKMSGTPAPAGHSSPPKAFPGPAPNARPPGNARPAGSRDRRPRGPAGQRLAARQADRRKGRPASVSPGDMLPAAFAHLPRTGPQERSVAFCPVCSRARRPDAGRASLFQGPANAAGGMGAERDRWFPMRPPLWGGSGCRKSGLRHFFEVFIPPLRLRRGQGAMQGNPCYARLFADLPYMPPNPIKA